MAARGEKRLETQRFLLVHLRAKRLEQTTSAAATHLLLLLLLLLRLLLATALSKVLCEYQLILKSMFESHRTSCVCSIPDYTLGFLERCSS